MTDQATSAAPPAYTMIFDQSAHLDWDWIRTFAQNYWYYKYGQGVNDIIATGIQNAKDGKRLYYYTICEMGFFRRFLETNPEEITTIQALGENLQILSGGVTSADCLVCSGEGFIRNYLIGQTWLRATTGLVPKPHCWLPDDFGQGPELPTLLAALGFVSVGFSRLPGTLSTCSRPALRDSLMSEGVDFIWTASDGSSVIAHWNLGSGYSYGNGVLKHGISPFVEGYGQTEASPPTYTAAATPFMYIPIDDDFSMPLNASDLQKLFAEWNSSQAETSNVEVKLGTFDHFITGLQASKSALTTRSYNGTPYWTGYYASRPELKILHYEAVRALAAAEVIGLLTRPSDATVNSMLPADFWPRVEQAWMDFAPSTHHDYVCGTAPDAVYAGDQLPLLCGAAAASLALRGIALNALGGMAAVGDSPSVIVANPLGFARSGVAAIEGVMPSASSLTWPDSTTTATQQTADGGMLVYATAPSFGYVVGTDDGGASEEVDTAALSPQASGAESYTISNGLLTATITAEAGWGIASLTDTVDGGAEVLSTAGNVVTFYDDSADGGIYQFSNEYPDRGGTMPPISGVTVTTSGAGLGAVVLEAGPLRVRLRTEVMYTLQAPGAGTVQVRFVREYSLHAGEPFLRMTTTGAAPVNTSVMTTFPLAAPVTAMTHGTGYHWTDVQPLDGFWGPPTFRATHDFVLPRSDDGTVLAAAYHGGMPAWAFDADGALIGCLLRNTPTGGSHGASGSDPAPHTQHYALRVPTGLGQAATGQPLREAQGFHTPLLAAQMPQGGSFPGTLSARHASLAALPPDSAAIATVAKPGSYDPTSLVLRLYQPTNAALTVSVTLPQKPASAELVTAAETAWSGGGGVTSADDAVTVEMVGAIATVSIAGMGRSG